MQYRLTKMAATRGKPGVATAVNAGYVSQAEGKRTSSYWKTNTNKVPGSIKPVHPTNIATDVIQHQPKGRNSPNKSKNKKDSFADFDDSTSDAWEVNDDELILMTSRKLSVEVHGTTVPGLVHVRGHRSDRNIADSEDDKTPSGQDRSNLPSVPSLQNTDVSERTESDVRIPNPAEVDQSSADRPSSRVEQSSLVAPRPSSPIRISTIPFSNKQDEKADKFWAVLSAPNMEMETLRKHSWAGIPNTVRPVAWKILSGYLPANLERRQATLDRKREEYFGFVDQYYDTRNDAQHKNMFHQIHIDIPRTNPLIPLFQEPVVQEIFERILYIWALKHPASGYVQGINDLVTPFFVVFLSQHIGGEDIEKVEKYKGINKLSKKILREIEADSFWCMSKLLDGIQDNYTFAQPGIQLKVVQLKELIQRINAPLHKYLMENQLDYLQFAFRWMNNLLMREFPLSCTVRLWDTYMSEPEGFAVFHLYVCAALLEMFSTKIMNERDFQGTMLFLQNLPTQNWGNKDISLLVAEAYKLKYMFADAPRHLNQQTKR
ncbi:TBC1 domain family member 22B [Strongylocentrotus purpuratus]|uniref:Rab-GAP TBC domain-containing protein n=1 Tax=Strongylocentrotus purpuratus TaxID=7668 RepID=A0A7M7RHB8_STRPU|nr:TBC1 domain family member 22B [Strongylocentrotus purpuratus]|eukprot:XP_797601.2 PREDICTED: TBC1 domain family member 22B isoform X1 [Strongylocentrotus purpuratus]